MSRRTISVLRAVGAGALFACGIGLGAHNGWLMALLAGIPLIVTGVVIAPRPTRVSELPAWGEARPGVGAHVDAITRSTLGAVDRQPCLVTATVSPADDTAYEARWLTSMTRSDVTALLDDPRVELPDTLVPARTPASPEFDDVPGRWVLIHPVATIVVMAAVVAAVPASAWHVDISTSSMPGSSRGSSDKNVTADRLNAARAHALTLSPTAAENILSFRLSDSSDSVDVLLPDTGQVVSAYYSRSSKKWYEPSTRETRSRRGDAFAASELDRFDLTAVSAAMRRGAGDKAKLLQLDIKRPATGVAPLATGTVGPDVFTETTVQARLTGEVAEVFDPGDLPTSMRIAADAIRDAKLSTSAAILTRFEIRGTRTGTPIMRAGSIQNSGGVLIEYSTEKMTGQVVVRPGEFPTSDSPPYENKAGPLPRGGVAFDRLSATTFARIRDDAMRRGDVEAFDRTAVDLQVDEGGSKDDYGPIVFAAVGPAATSVGTYNLAGDFLRSGTS